MRTIFEYCYRDAGNFKAFGTLLLDGTVPSHLEAQVRSALQDGQFFIAEQIGVLPLYNQLYKWSGGAIEADHCWHEFVGFKETDNTDSSIECAGTAAEFAARFASVAQWNEELSPHFGFFRSRVFSANTD